MKAPLEPAAIAAAVRETLRAQAGRDLNALLKRWRYQFSQDDSIPELPQETARFLIRFGVLDSGMDAAARQAAFGAWLKSASRASGEAPGILAAWLRCFAAGEYGVLDEGLCGDVPRCAACGLKENCRYVLSGATDARTDENGLMQALAAQQPTGAAELLAFLISGEKYGAGSVARAEALLKARGGLRGTLQTSAEELSAAGLSDSECARVAALSQWVKLWAEERAGSDRIFRSGKDFYDAYHLRLRELKQEVFIVVLLNQKNRRIDDEQVSVGTLNETLVHPREVFSSAIAQRAAAIAVIHNHPSGDPTPSAADKAITRRLTAVSQTIGIRLLDHVIIGDGRYVSFVDENLLSEE